AVTFPVKSGFHTSVHNLTAAELQAVDHGEVPDGWPVRERWRKPEEQLLFVLDGEHEQLWWAEIVRPHGEAPLLGYWATLPDATERGGMYADVRGVLRRHRPHPSAPTS